MVWHWWVVLAAVLVCVGVGVGIAFVRSPEYTATSRLAVGRIDITSPGALSGYATAAEALATGYSRAATARAVAKDVSGRTGLPVNEVESSVTATPIPESPIFKIEASAAGAGKAVALANGTAHALIRYETRLNQSNPDSRRLYAQYRAAGAKEVLARAGLREALEAAGSQPTPEGAEAVAKARGEVEAASLRVKALATAYTTSVQSQVATQLIQVISPATSASSDRTSTALILGFIGLVVGLLIGGSIAYARESRLGS
jgi:capsular polysaccharide biosynthesis protein